MRVSVVVVIAAALAVSACASTGLSDRSAARYAVLSQACGQRGGILVPAFGGYRSNGGYRCEASGPADTRYTPRGPEVR